MRSMIWRSTIDTTCCLRGTCTRIRHNAVLVQPSIPRRFQVLAERLYKPRSLCTPNIRARAWAQGAKIISGTVGLHTVLRPTTVTCEAATPTPSKQCGQDASRNQLKLSAFNQPSAVSRIVHFIGATLVAICSSACCFVPILIMWAAGAQWQNPILHYMFRTMRVQTNADTSTISPITCQTQLIHSCCVSPCVSSMTLGVGNFLWAVFDPHGQTLSEFLMGIHTVYTEPQTFPYLRPEESMETQTNMDQHVRH